MTKNILLLHHFETMWSDGFKMYGTSFEKCMANVIDYLVFSGNHIDELIVTRFEDHEWEPEHGPLLSVCESLGINVSLEVYGYGFRRCLDEDESAHDTYPDDDFGVKWCFGDRDHHEDEDILEIDGWHHELKGSHVILGGAFEGECLNDIEKVLSTLKLDVEKFDGLCVGTGVQYESFAVEKIGEELSHSKRIEELDEEISGLLDDQGVSDLMDLADDNSEAANIILKKYREIMEDFVSEFSDVFDLADNEILLEYYPSSRYSELDEVFETMLEGGQSDLESVISENIESERYPVSIQP